jgi:hypothetical protein
MADNAPEPFRKVVVEGHYYREGDGAEVKVRAEVPVKGGEGSSRVYLVGDSSKMAQTSQYGAEDLAQRIARRLEKRYTGHYF